MSHPSPHIDDDEPLSLKSQPRPRRPFEIGSPSDPPTPTHDNPPSSFPSSSNLNDTPSRNRSFLNLTSSTLFGIYGGAGTDTVSPTPFGDGTQTPAERRSFDFTRSGPALPQANAYTTKGLNGKLTRRRESMNTKMRRKKGFKNFVLPTAARLVTLFAMGGGYGLLISHLHDRQHLAPATVALDRERYSYYFVWGIIGMILGEALPWVDMLWAEEEDEDAAVDEKPRGRRRESWLDAVRSIGLFVGIAFAIRKLPWQSTLQLSLTLALANPAVWYLVDRSPPGFILSTIVALGGTVVTLGVFPNLLPSPTPAEVLRGHVRGGNGTLPPGKEELVLGVFTSESVGVATWIASVLFVSAVCFGNVGRRLVGREH